MEQKFCQSCAMPLGGDVSMYGTNADGSANTEYCKYCYENGAFTSDMTMDQMIDICVPHMVQANNGMTEESAREMMRSFFPTLKRWKA
jgi:hypothetical protein